MCARQQYRHYIASTGTIEGLDYSAVVVPLRIMPVSMRQATIPAPYSGNRHYSAQCHTGPSHLCRAISQALYS